MEQLNSVLVDHMGDSFYRLSPLLQKSHIGKNKLEGKVSVRRGGFLAGLLCDVLNFPKESESTHLIVDCEHTKEAMIWRRNFDGLIMPSHFSKRESFLIEKLGPLDLFLNAVEDNGVLRYELLKTHFIGIRLPTFLAPQVEAHEEEINGQYQFSVEVKMFLIGFVIAYSGTLGINK